MRRNSLPLWVLLCVVASLSVTAPWAGPGPDSLGDSPSRDWMGRVQQEIQDAEYRLTWQTEPLLRDLGPAWHAPNRAQNLRTYFTESGIRIIERQTEEPDWVWGLSLEAIGRGDRSIAVGPSAPIPTENRIEYPRDVITEWYLNDPRGLEQGFNLTAPPERLGLAGPTSTGLDAPLFLQLALHGSLLPDPGPDGKFVDFLTAAGSRVLRYSDLIVLDAVGQRVPAWMELFAEGDKTGIRLWVDDRTALYPLVIDPLASSPTWTTDGAQALANFGQSVASAGDVNGDQYSDVIIGAPFFDNGSPGEGVAFVFHGSPSGLSVTADWSAENNQGGANFGFSVASAGDVNGDGYTDVIIGANMNSGSEDDEGRVWVWHGSADGLGAIFSWTVDSDQDFAQLGHSVASAGDVNKDGFSDVIIAAPYWNTLLNDVGKVSLHYGSANGLGVTAVWSYTGTEIDAALGYSVASAGDVNGDGFSDIVIGQPFADQTHPEQGRALIFHGSSHGLGAAPDAQLQIAQSSAWCGWAVSTAGDVTSDGYSDVLLGCPLYDFSGDVNVGGAFLFEGSASGVSSISSWSAVGPHAGAQFGTSVSTAGDVDGNSFADVVVGAPMYENGEVLEGAAFFFESSATGLATTPSWSAECDQVLCRFGGSVATAGDVNGDGYSDVLVGANQYDGAAGQDEGRAYLYRGSGNGPDDFSSWSVESDLLDADLGYSVSTAGDTNADGFDDVIVGAPLYDNGHPEEGRVLVYLSSAAGVDTSPQVILDGGSAGSKIGWSVAALDDVNGDGFDDVAVGCPEFSNPELREGLVFILFGSVNGSGSAPGWLADIDQQDAKFGFSVAGAGDVNGDGKADLIVGAPGYATTAADQGRVYVYLDIHPGPPEPANWIIDGDQGGAQFGYSVDSAGDVDGDGLSEVIIGAPFHDGSFTNQGRVYAYRGSVFGPLTQPFWTAEGPHDSASFGLSVSGAGDVDGDGHTEVLVGSPLYANGQTAEGAAFLYQGSTSGLSSSHVWSVESNQPGAEMGHSVASAGDINGDGYAEVIIGAPLFSNGESEEGLARVYSGSAGGLGSLPVWSVESNELGARFGWSVASAGDVNADGYGDLIVGAPEHSNGENSEGQALMYYGTSYAAFLLPQQRQADDLNAIGLGGVSSEVDEFRLSMFGRTPFGMGQVKIQWEVKPLGTPFDSIPSGSASTWTSTVLPTDPPAEVLSDPVAGLTPGKAYHWRARLLYNPVQFPLQQHGRWVHPPTGSWEETDLRLWAEIDLGVDQVDSKDPVFVGESYDYLIDATNDGPDGIDATVQITLPVDVDLETATPSQGECIDSDHVITCYLGWIASGGSATAVVSVLPQVPGSQTNIALVDSPAATDSSGANDSSTISTLIKPPMLGNFVWDDLNGDGIQDDGEPGMANVLVATYSSAGTLVGTVVTDGTGHYEVPGLFFASDYYLRFFPPPGYVLTLAHQGSDDLVDSDADPFTLETPVISLVEQSDLVRWDAGMIPHCVAPDETVYIGSMSLTDDGNEYPILNFLDANQPSQVTGYNIYRSSDPVPPPSTWPLLATDVIDMDEATPNKQWIDTTGDVSPSGTWFYKVSGYNHRCPAEGPL